MQAPLQRQDPVLESASLNPVQTAQLQLALHALTQQYRNLVLYCSHAAQAKTIARTLAPQISRWWPHTQVHHCQAGDGHQLLQALNEALQAQPPGTQDSVSPGKPFAPQVWLVHGAAFPQTEDLTLLLRMLNTFEHLPLRAVVLLTDAPPSNPALSAELSRLHEVQLEAGPPSLMPGHEATPTPQAIPELAAVVPGQELGQAPVTAPLNPAPWKLPLGVALATALIGALAWWSQRIGEPVLQYPVAAGTAPTSSAAASEPPPGSLPVSGTPEAEASDAAVVGSSPPESTPDSALANTSALAPPADAASAADKAPPKATRPETASSANATAAPVSLQASRRWLAGLPAQTWVVEHSRHSNLSQARRSTSGRQHLREARIVPIRHKGQTQYLVITGPFRSAERAETYLQRLQVKGRMHKTSTLRPQMAP